ncbi:MAG: hypothetical protein ACI4IQ_04065, partial [Eubacterium sp.]
FMNEMIITEIEDNKKFNFDFKENRAIIYTIIFYSVGLFLGAYFYKIASGDSLNNLIKPEAHTLMYLFSSNLCIYFSLFIIVVFLGFCLIGYPLINLIPAIIGIETGIRCAYFFINYSIKGIGYALIMIIPFVALFQTVIAFTIKISTEMSKNLAKIAKNGSASEGIDIKPYLKKYLILGISIIIAAFVNAGLTTILFSVVTI